MRTALVVTCEHGGNAIPRRWARCFEGKAAALRSHRGYDPGAAGVAKRLAGAFGVEAFVATTSRLLVDLNRSPGHPRLFSEMTRELPDEEKRRILATVYEPHRTAVERAIASERRRGAFVVHVAVHSFTPVLEGDVRNAEIGLLYDPRRKSERGLCSAWHAALAELSPELRIRRNYPYRGASDGFTSALRKQYAERAYAGIELEMNQALFERGRASAPLAGLLVASLRDALRDTRRGTATRRSP